MLYLKENLPIALQKNYETDVQEMNKNSARLEGFKSAPNVTSALIEGNVLKSAQVGKFREVKSNSFEDLLWH